MIWKFLKKRPKTSEAEAPPKKLSFKWLKLSQFKLSRFKLNRLKLSRIKRWQLIGLAGLCIILMSYLMYVNIASMIHLASTKTPLPTPPELAVDISAEEASKTEQYAQEQRNKKKDARKEQEENNRMDRISVGWDRLYKQPAEEEQIAELPPEAPKARVQRARRRTTYRPPKAVPKPEYKPISTVSFNLKREKGHPVKQVFNQASSSDIQNVQFVSAVIFGEQAISTGEVVRLRLTQPIYVKGIEIPAHTILTGIGSIGQRRINIQIDQVLVGTTVIPVDFQCYDLDYTKGLPYDDPKMAQQLRQEVSRDARSQVPSLRTGVPLVDPFLGTASNVVREVIRGSGKKNRSLPLADNYRLLIKI